MKQASQLLTPIVAIALLLCTCSDENDGNNYLSNNEQNRTLTFSDSLAFISTEGDTVAAIAVAIADEPRERNRGLMHITELGEDEGMLFIFQREKPLSFWMANTPLSLDIIFVNSNKKIVRIHHAVPPFTKQNFKSGEPAMYAIETNAGFTIANDIREGMEVQFWFG